MRSAISVLAAVVFCLLAVPARADLLYSLTLTQDTGKKGGNAGNGTGGFEISTAPVTGKNQQSTYLQGGDLEELTFSIGQDTFTIDEGSGAFVQFTSGKLSDITYAGSDLTSTVILSLSANGLVYNFSDSGKNETGVGKITVGTPSVVPHGSSITSTPEPSSFILLGTALFSGAGIFRRRLS